MCLIDMDLITTNRFWIKVNKTAYCWLWAGSTNGLGYGEMRIKGTKYYAHRLSYSLHKGLIPTKYDIDHLCRNPSCVNPDHLESVTHIVNVRRGKAVGPRLNKRKTHCKNGHDYAITTRLKKSGIGRNCSLCMVTAAKKYRERNL